MSLDAAAPIRTAVVGFGISGKVFHAPLLGRSGLLAGRDRDGGPGRAAEAARLYPHARIVPTPEALFALAGDLDLVILGTPAARTSTSPHGHRPRPSRGGGQAVRAHPPRGELIALASDGGVQLTVFQNRRWDADFLTLQSFSGGRWVRSAPSSRGSSGGGPRASELEGRARRRPRAAGSSTTSART